MKKLRLLVILLGVMLLVSPAFATMKAAVQDVSVLPTTGNTASDTRVVTDVREAFTWNGTYWAPSAMALGITPTYGKPVQDLANLGTDSANVVRAVLDLGRLYVSSGSGVWAPIETTNNPVFSSFTGAGVVTGGTGLVATTGGVTASAGNIVATLGNITASAGNIAATLGSVSAGTTVTAGTGITATTGGVTITAGGLTVTAGNITANASTLSIGKETMAGGSAYVPLLIGTKANTSGSGVVLAGDTDNSGGVQLYADDGGVVTVGDVRFVQDIF